MRVHFFFCIDVGTGKGELTDFKKIEIKINRSMVHYFRSSKGLGMNQNDFLLHSPRGVYVFLFSPSRAQQREAERAFD